MPAGRRGRSGWWRAVWAGLAVLVAAIGYPLLETFWWWRLWLGPRARPVAPTQPWSTALLYLAGSSDFTRTTLLPQQRALLERASAILEPDVVLTGPFPYETVTAHAYRRYDLWPRLGYGETPLWVYSLRNFWQAGLSTWCAPRYGADIARCIGRQLGPPQAAARLVVLGNSAGAAMALSAAPHLQSTWPDLQVDLVICGGVFGAVPGLATITSFQQLLGRRDGWARLAEVLAPHRRRRRGHFQRAIATGRYLERLIGDQRHFGPEGYFSDRYFAATVEAVGAALREQARPTPG